MINTWQQAIGSEKQQAYFQQILNTVQQEREQGIVIYPPNADVFNAFKVTEFDQIKVVILGQDPYHNINQAHGLAFSVQQGVSIPPSLCNIYKELQQDIKGFLMPRHGCLTSWAKQGVLLLNTVLTVRAHCAHSHANIGWERFTDRVISQINAHREHVVCLLWGNHAQKKGTNIDRMRHLVLTAPHPSPLSAHRGFFGCRHFSRTNEYLQQHHITPIDWQIP